MTLILNKTYRITEINKPVSVKPWLNCDAKATIVLPGSRAIFSVKVPRYPGATIVANYDIPDDARDTIHLSNARYHLSLMDAVQKEGLLDTPEHHNLKLFFHCQECGLYWNINTDITDLCKMPLVYDEKICPRCGEPCNAGIYKIVIDDDFELPLYRGPLV